MRCSSYCSVVCVVLRLLGIKSNGLIRLIVDRFDVHYFRCWLSSCKPVMSLRRVEEEEVKEKTDREAKVGWV
jgi:hypothetical protein